MPVTDFTGSVALVTGAAGGIGLGIAEALLAEGARVALADIDTVELGRTVDDLKARGHAVLGVELDVTDRAAWAAAVDLVRETWGELRVLVNNAGVSTLGMPFETIEPTLWDKVVDINLTGVYNGIHASLASLLADGGGHIVNTASVGGLLGIPALGPYVATKFAVVGLSEALRAELSDQGVGVSVLCPASVRSRLWRTSRPVRGLPDVDTPPADASGQSGREGGMDPAEVGRRVVDGVRRNDLYILTHPEIRSWLVRRHDGLVAALDHAGEYVD
ncbi:hypothetical protein GCM10009836_25880 [Pseudonocardia ailaonensis]|uniref:Ketoreductase domain-containing protein n=1 Tax=Pseudonocardia ailaonensis TaxID=367279 RepID=A0ABN2MZQ7_9PSEU